MAWAKRSDWTSLAVHGVVGDGVSGDIAAIQAAMDLMKDGSTLCFTPGRHRITQIVGIDGPTTGLSSQQEG